MSKRYLLYVEVPYAYSIMRPLEHEAWRQGHEVAWYVEPQCVVDLREGERLLRTIDEAIAFNPLACFVPSNYIPHFLPGVKVNIFHGYPIFKRPDNKDDHFTIRGWFDIYCTQGPSSTASFRNLEQKYGYFKVYETGWPKADSIFRPENLQLPHNQRPCILYSSTFTHNISSAATLLPTIEHMAKTQPWDWLITFHPKLQDPQVIDGYQRLADENANVTFHRGTDHLPLLRQADVMLCDSSSIIIEFMFLDKPVVTFRNTKPGPHLLNVTEPDEVEETLRHALTRPDDLMRQIKACTMRHEPHRDCQCSARVLAAVDDFIANHKDHMKRKPLNLVRKFKLRKHLHYWKGGLF